MSLILFGRALPRLQVPKVLTSDRDPMAWFKAAPRRRDDLLAWAVAVPLCFLASHLLLRRIPLLKRFCERKRDKGRKINMQMEKHLTM